MLIDYKLDLAELEKLIKEYPDISRDVRVGKIQEAVLLLEREIKEKTPVGAGPIHLRDTIHQKVQVSGARVIGIVGTPLKHGVPVEMGTRPHFPPLGPIQLWVEKKLGYEGKEAKSVAFLIARAISKRGTKGREMFGSAFEDNESRLRDILGTIPDEIARRAEAVK